MKYEEFRRKILKLCEKRNHKVKNSYGVYDAFKYYRELNENRFTIDSNEKEISISFSSSKKHTS